ncbi:MAG: aspartate-semialdehyde dehydrogenase [Bacteroidales bacterium]|nr:aspartate-semialdehyde dehydrogenase [Bacteroidales bacterium]
MKIAVIGATGLVGNKIIEILEERNFPVSELIPAATEKSVGKQIKLNSKSYKVVNVQSALDLKPAIAIFSAGGDTAKEWAPKFAFAGTFVIDNSSAWRMDKNVKLIVPEINGNTIEETDKIIANPNCSTIQLVVAIAPLHERYIIKRIIVSTYQSVSGSGVKALWQLENERKGVDDEKVYPHRIDKNCLPHCDVFLENGYTKEEMKIVNETRKILNKQTIGISSTAVRVPVTGGHSESVYLEFEKDFQLNVIRNILAERGEIVLQDEPANNLYPMPINAEGSDQVFVGRIRRDLSNPQGLNLWVVSDNLRKGAATNAVQIAEIITEKFFSKYRFS